MAILEAHCAPPRTQATSRSPAPLGLKCIARTMTLLGHPVLYLSMCMFSAMFANIRGFRRRIWNLLSG